MQSIAESLSAIKKVGPLVAVSLLMACSGTDRDRFPTRPIELVVAFPPGGVTDLAGRVFAEALSSTLKIPVIARNRGGGSGALGASVVLQARKDGYTLLANSISGMVLAPAVMPDVVFMADRDFVPIALILTVPDSLIVKADSPFKTVDDLIDAARQKPGRLSYASAGTASDGHFNGEVLAGVAGIRIKHVPFKGGSELATAVMGGHVDFGIGAATSFIALDHGARVRTLAVTGDSRLKALPDVPTFAERGVHGAFVNGWAGCFAPAGTPQPVIDVLVDAAARVTQSSAFITRIEAIGGIAGQTTPQGFLGMIREDMKTASAIAKKVRLLQDR